MNKTEITTIGELNNLEPETMILVPNNNTSSDRQGKKDYIGYVRMGIGRNSEGKEIDYGYMPWGNYMEGRNDAAKAKVHYILNDPKILEEYMASDRKIRKRR